MLIAKGGSSGTGSLRTLKKYENFTLKLKFRLPRRAPGDQQYFGDTGVVIYRQEAVDSHPSTGFSVNWAEPGTALNVGVNKMATIAVQKLKHYRPAGDWNDAEVKSIDGVIETAINGNLTIRLDDCRLGSGYIALIAQGVSIDHQTILIHEPRREP